MLRYPRTLLPSEGQGRAKALPFYNGFIKSRNISDNGKEIIDIPGYDSYIEKL